MIPARNRRRNSPPGILPRLHATQLGTSIASAAPIDSIVIVGAGFSGTALAIRLARAARGPLDITLIEPPFIASLIAAGFVRADALALGLEISADGRPVGADGAAVDRLWYLGPWLRARDWEATAVPELRDHAARLAQRILSMTGAAARTP